MLKIKINYENFQKLMAFISKTNLIYQVHLGRLALSKSDMEAILSFEQKLIPLIPKVGYTLFKCKELLKEILEHNQEFQLIDSNQRVVFEQVI